MRIGSGSTQQTQSLQASGGPDRGAGPTPGQDYVVREGDNLASIAAHAAINAGERGRPLSWAAAIAQENSLDASQPLRPGDVLHIPEQAPPLPIKQPGRMRPDAEAPGAPAYFPTPQTADTARQQATVGNTSAEQLRARTESAASEGSSYPQSGIVTAGQVEAAFRRAE